MLQDRISKKFWKKLFNLFIEYFIGHILYNI